MIDQNAVFRNAVRVLHEHLSQEELIELDEAWDDDAIDYFFWSFREKVAELAPELFVGDGPGLPYRKG